MTDKTTQEEMDAAKREMDQLLHEMVIAPLKSDLTALLDEALYPLDKDAKERNDSVMAQLSKIRRTLERHYPDHSAPLVEQLQALADAQSETEVQVRSQAERWERQVEAVGQQTVQAVRSQNDTLTAHLGDRLQTLQSQIQDCLKQLSDDNRMAICRDNNQLFERLRQLGGEHMKRLEVLSAALATKTHAVISEKFAQREQHLQASFAAQTADSKAHYEAILKACSAFAQGLAEQRDQISDLQLKLQRSSLYGRVLLCSCLPLGVASFALLAYLLSRFG